MSVDTADRPLGGAVDAFAATPVSEATYAAIRDFLFAEASMLDNRRYVEWFALLTPDIRYRITAHSTRSAGTEAKEVVILDDAAAEIELRVKQISTPNLTYSENPAPLMRRFVSNIRVQGGPGANDFAVESYLLMCRNGGALSESFTYPIVRRDTLRRVDGTLRIARRHALLDQTLIGTSNLATFV
jgi:3-phenylpropionate/cinnamic acid dioxygenase small subunit